MEKSSDKVKTGDGSTWSFPRAFWIANTVELLERAAFYAMFIAITLYLTDLVGFNDVQAGIIGGIFSAGLYFFPPFTGAFADRIGFRKGLILAFSLLSIGYFALGLLPYKTTVVPALFIVMLGGSFIKSIITGTVAVTTDKINRARGYSIFYAIVNVGAFSGKMFAAPLRIELGLASINYFSAIMAALAIIVTFYFYRNIDTTGMGKSLKETWSAFIRVLTNMRLLSLILIVTGFWIIQQQLYATMPKYVIRTVGASAKPEWYANVNPAIVMIFVMLITQMMRKAKPITSMTIGMFIMPISALSMSLSSIWQGSNETIDILGIIALHPITLMMVIGIMFQGLAECFISPRYLEFFSLQAPKGEEGLYLGFGHIHTFFAALIGFIVSGFLLDKYCPDPNTLTPEQMVHAYDKAYIIWYYFAAIGLTAGIALIIYNVITKRIDSRKMDSDSN